MEKIIADVVVLVYWKCLKGEFVSWRDVDGDEAYREIFDMRLT